MQKFIQPAKVKHVKGSVIAPENAGLRIILNLCSQSGKYNSTLFSALTKRWMRVREDYKNWFAGQVNFKLGNISTTAIASDTWVVHSLCFDKEEALNAEALKACVKKIVTLAKSEKASLHVSEFLFRDVPELKTLLEQEVPTQGVLLYEYSEGLEPNAPLPVKQAAKPVQAQNPKSSGTKRKVKSKK